ncbi:MAG: transposase [Clostridiales bacterium]|nr:transposase [Clostridiales bacterium]
MFLRILCIEVSDGVFEYLATNLDRDEFPLDVMKDLYHMRWGEETSFRELKYTIDLVHFHGRKRESVEQEAWARLILYNCCEAITRHIAVSKQGSPKRKYDQKINFATAACICKAFLKRSDDEINTCR